MDSQTLARVFEPFFTTKEVGKGSGLGLAQVYGLARSAGGDVSINSKVGVGTTVKLYFPRSSDVASEEAQATSSKVPLRRAASGETVLLVEDDEQVLDMAIESLEELHYKVVVAHNAREALDHLKGSERIDILFSDVVMPGGMNGAQLAAEARHLRPGLQVLLTSGYVAEANDHGIGLDVPVLNKPYRRDELARTLRVVLGGGPAVSSSDALGTGTAMVRRQPPRLAWLKTELRSGGHGCGPRCARISKRQLSQPAVPARGITPPGTSTG